MEWHGYVTNLITYQELSFNENTSENYEKWIKGQLLSGWFFDFLIFQNTNARIWWISALESKKLLNQKDKGPIHMLDSP